MKFLTSILFLLFISLGYSQIKFNPEARIIANFGQNEAEKLVKERPNIYNLYVFRLNHACEIVDTKEGKKNSPDKNRVFKKDGQELTKEIVSSKGFNYVQWSIEPHKDISKYYLLSDGSYLKVRSLVDIYKEFMDSPKNTKNLY